MLLVHDLLEILAFEENIVVPKTNLDNNDKLQDNPLKTMPLEKLQEMINQKLNEAKHKYSAVMKYSITQNWLVL